MSLTSNFIQFISISIDLQRIFKWPWNGHRRCKWSCHRRSYYDDHWSHFCRMCNTRYYSSHQGTLMIIDCTDQVLINLSCHCLGPRLSKVLTCRTHKPDQHKHSIYYYIQTATNHTKIITTNLHETPHA